MDNEKFKRISDIRASLGSLNSFSENNDLDNLEDPISAYFKQRCGNFSKTYFKKHTDSDSDSSFGLIDVDRVSLFDDKEENDNENLRFSEDMLEQIKKTDAPKVVITEVESELDKQRALAQKTLKRLSDGKTPSKKSTLTPKKTENKVLADISSKLMNVKLSVDKDSEEWFQPNFSPNTPRYFNDELSSLNGEDETVSYKSEKKVSISNVVNENRQSRYTKKVNSVIEELNDIPVCSDFKFETQTTEEQINRLEEDEKKFKLENSALLHNSQISQFSGVGAEDISQWPSETPNAEQKSEIKNLSIGQFFNIRSNRVSSLVGSVADVSSIPDLNQQLETLTEGRNQLLSRSECSFSIGEKIPAEKTNFRRCVSNLDLKRSPEIAKSMRNSSASSSNSTLMIQDMIAEMESGLSGTQIYEKLLKSYKRKKIEGQKHKKAGTKETLKISENNETPKSSKFFRQKDTIRSCKKAQFFNESRKESKSLGGQNSVFSSDKEFKENKTVRILNLNETVPSASKEKIKKTGNSKGFYASTPKSQAVKFQDERFQSPRGRILISSEDWETPRVHSIQPIDLDRSEFSEDYDKTVTVNSTSTCSDLKKSNDTVTIEDTIVAGDLTVLSQRIEEMKRDSVCIVRPDEPKEPVLLTVVQKLSYYPKGSLDCSALAPLIRDQFPELLSYHQSNLEDISVCAPPHSNITEQDDLVALPGSSVKLPNIWGLKQKVYSCADLSKKILIPVVNMSHKWFLVSLEYLELVSQQGKKLPGVKKNEEWCVSDFVSVSLKRTFLPPENQQFLKIFFKSKVTIKFEIILTFHFKDLMNRELQKRNVRLLVSNINPENYINVLPKDPINFGVIADQCFDQTVVQVTFDGICELPLTVYIEEDESVSGHFILKPVSGQQRDQKFKDNICYHVFEEGEKQMFEFRVCFLPNMLLKEDSKIQDFKALLVLMLGGKTDSDGILRKIPIKGSVGYAHFLCNFSCCPLVFRASERGQSITRTYPLKNIGSIPIAFYVSIISENTDAEEGDLFVAPNSFYLAKDEEAGFNITFNARSNQDCVKRLLRLQMKPNGRVLYEAELIGMITSSESRPLSRTSGASVSTKLTTDSESVPVKLVTTCFALSWTAVALENEAKQSCQIKILSSANASVRVTFERNSEAFKLVNENGEKVHKLRRTLMPDCPCVLTVVFRPDVVGAYNNALILETNRSSRTNTIVLNGIGGIPNVQMKNVRTDLMGCKILSLQYSNKSNEFESTIVFTNTGRIPAFVYLKFGIKDFSLSHELTVSPSSVVINPDSSVSIKVSQKLKNRDLQQLLSDKEIRRVATICMACGDEPSRLRLRKIVNSGKVQASERLKDFTTNFLHEKTLNLKNFKDQPGFEMEFLKSLKCYDIAVVIEKGFETSFLEETADEFISFCSDNTVIPANVSKTYVRPTTRNLNKSLQHIRSSRMAIGGYPLVRKSRLIDCRNSQLYTESSSGGQNLTFSAPVDLRKTDFFAEPMSTNNKITKWFDTLECL